LTLGPINAIFPTGCCFSSMTKRNNDSAALHKLSRRERQVMEIVYAQGGATASDIHKLLPDPPTFSATRAVIRTLEDKGYLRHEEQGLRYLYLPTASVAMARKSALASIVSTFFHGSPTQVMAALLDQSSTKISDEDLDRIEAMIRDARNKSRE
jgi:predicted transcriptional regulator